MLFVSWNVNSLRARLPRLLDLVALYRPDVLAVQETKCSEASFPMAQLEAAGYAAVHSSGGQWAGVALLTRLGLPAADPLVGLPGDPMPGEARWCETTVSGIRFVSTYVPNGRSLNSPEYPRKLAFLEAAALRAAALRAESSAPLVIAGDVNIAPAAIDVYDPEEFDGATHVSEPEREGLRQLMAAGELVDGYRHLHPDEQQFTWWDYRAGNFHKGLGMRIDLALISSKLAPRVQSCGIDREFRKGPKPSDHAPLMLRFDWF